MTAIRAGGDPAWLPLHDTPAHPSGHNTYSGSAERVLTALAGHAWSRTRSAARPHPA